MSDVLFQEVPDKRHGDHDPDQGQEEGQLGGVIAQQPRLRFGFHKVGEVLQQHGSSARQQTNDQTQGQHQPALFNALGEA
ncbi:MAG: hypothetical protein KAS29_18835 [Bacteroidales bacterium]|nr:hypothetical protein [Bacteroidales bacterium]